MSHFPQALVGKRGLIPASSHFTTLQDASSSPLLKSSPCFHLLWQHPTPATHSVPAPMAESHITSKLCGITQWQHEFAWRICPLCKARWAWFISVQSSMHLGGPMCVQMKPSHMTSLCVLDSSWHCRGQVVRAGTQRKGQSDGVRGDTGTLSPHYDLSSEVS